jgi:DNA replication protein DnaC
VSLSGKSFLLGALASKLTTGILSRFLPFPESSQPLYY